MSDKTVFEAASSGDELATLHALRDRLAADIDNTIQPRPLAALALRLTDVLARIRDLAPVAHQESLADEIAERRAARRGAGAKRAPRATRTG